MEHVRRVLAPGKAINLCDFVVVPWIAANCRYVALQLLQRGGHAERDWQKWEELLWIFNVDF